MYEGLLCCGRGSVERCRVGQPRSTRCRPVRDTPLLPQSFGVLEQVASAGIGLLQLCLHLVTAYVHGVEVCLKVTQFL